MTEGKILIVDDDPYIILSLQTLLEQHYSFVQAISDPEEITGLITQDSFDVILLDMNFKLGDTSGREGIKWLKKILKIDPETNVVIITAYGGIHTAVKAMKAGAIDFIVKPWQNEKILSTTSAAFKLSLSKKKVTKLKSRQRILSSTIDTQFAEIIGHSPAIRKVFDDISKVARTEANIFILGENGTGKELVARALHRKSARAEEVFISVDLGSITESLFESELFGHVKGAFTDAREDRAGRFEAASCGTLFLDEVGNLPLSLQVKLLSVLENRKIIRVGSNKAIDVDIRLICATNQNVKEMIADGIFRQDLLYRINTVEISLPPLRDRIEDIPQLANYFLDKYSKKYRKPELILPKQVIKKLQRFNWPGNIREFQHAIERAVILSDGKKLETEDFKFLSNDKKEEIPFDKYNLENLEKWAILNCLEKHGGNVTKAATELGLTRGALYRRIEKYGK
ncbi:MAG: sigma-54-dependent Fis family transcriptional regulator [Bacteroidales bacterium]|nr:sigma-54-dependent Fis family transcriptional regulator [Bacteroidales bacterium]